MARRSLACSQPFLVSAALLLAASLAVGAEGLPAKQLFPAARFDPAIPTQIDELGFHPGARPMRHDELIRYLEALAEASPRAVLRDYAATHEGRRMVTLVVSGEATVAGLDSFREAHTERVDPRGHAAATDGERLADAKAVAWIAYGIHGDELSSVDAAAVTAYYLVAGEDEAARRLRERLVVLIDPCENPDGRERYLAQISAFAHKRPNPDTEDLSHSAVWPWGRGNHYLFDLNRDWFSMVHPESTRSEVIADWNPQLVVDSHEMGSHDSYLFSPSRHPFNPHLPDSNLRWAGRFAADQAAALDERGYAYYTREWNEEFFPGYGSSWASYRGAIGILYEMSGTEGTLVRQRGGVERTYAQAVEHQVTSSVANLSTLAVNRAEILADFVADRRAAMERAGSGWIRAWFLPEGRHPERTRKLVNLLRRQGIDVYRNTADLNATGLHDARTGVAVAASSLPTTVWMVPLDQPAGLLARELLDPHIPMESGFLREEREYLERGKGSRLYEVTAWSLALAYDVEAYWSGTRPTAGWSLAETEAAAGAFREVLAPYGWVIDGTADSVAGVVADLLQEEIHVRVAEKPFRVGGTGFEQGSLLIKREGNPDTVKELLRASAERRGVVVQAISTALAEKGPDLGGRLFKPLQPVRVGVWTGSPVSPPDYGAIWRLFDEDLELRFSGLDVGSFGRVSLERYNVLIFPPTFGPGIASYRAKLGEAGIARLKTWVEAGGTLIGIGSGAAFLADKQSGLTRTRLRSQALDTYPPVVWGPDAEQAVSAGPFRGTGVRAPEKPVENDGDKTKSKKRRGGDEGAAKPASPYDVAPVLGPGAKPFARGHDQGTAVTSAPVALADWIKGWLPQGKAKPDDGELSRADARLRSFAPRGAFVRVELDRNVWLGWGLPAELSALARGSDTLVAEPPVQVAARFADLDRLHLGGLLWPEAAGRLAHTAYATREGVGKGQVILFLHAPEFRGWTLGTRRLLTNAVLFGPGLGTSWPNPW